MRSIRRAAALAIVVLSSVPLVAQVAPEAQGGSKNTSPSKWEIFAGYSYLAPHATLQTTVDKKPVSATYHDVKFGEIGSFSFFFNRYVGVQAEVGIHEWGVQNKNPAGQNGTQGNNDGFTSLAGGVVLRFPGGRLTPFVHAVGGEALMDGPAHNLYTWGPAIAGGGGLDLNTRWFHHRLAIRLIQADYEYFHVDYGTGNLGGQTGINAERLSAGIVFPVNAPAREPVLLVCSANPTSIFAGEPLTVTADAGNLDPKLNVLYYWSGNGVKGDGATAAVSTATFPPGTYTVLCGVKEGKAGKEGLKPWQSAQASASFNVKQFEPPTISCSASPATIKPGDSSMINSAGVSPQNRPLTYSYSAAAGTMNGSTASAEYSSVGAPVGAVEITCNATDDRGQTATAKTSVTITAPYVPPVPHTQALCSISFATDRLRPTRVNNEAKACLDEVALDLQRQPDAKVVLVGDSNSKEKTKTASEDTFAQKHKRAKVDDLAAERAVNAKDYLVTEKGIDAARVSVMTGRTNDQNVEDYLVPAGANFSSDVSGTAKVDETAVKAQPRQPLVKPRMHKRAEER
jgi:outer membrane protein OmpA-like peptidoglycan-associated protein